MAKKYTSIKRRQSHPMMSLFKQIQNCLISESKHVLLKLIRKYLTANLQT